EAARTASANEVATRRRVRNNMASASYSIGGWTGLSGCCPAALCRDECCVHLGIDRVPDKPHGTVSEDVHRAAGMERIGFVVVVTVDHHVPRFLGGEGIPGGGHAIQAVLALVVAPAGAVCRRRLAGNIGRSQLPKDP